MGGVLIDYDFTGGIFVSDFTIELFIFDFMGGLLIVYNFTGGIFMSDLTGGMLFIYDFAGRTFIVHDITGRIFIHNGRNTLYGRFNSLFPISLAEYFSLLISREEYTFFI